MTRGRISKKHSPPGGSLATPSEPAEDGVAEPVSRGRRGGCLQILLGVLLIAVGIPMLVLPGPGLIAIGGGVVLVLRGFGVRGR